MSKEWKWLSILIDGICYQYRRLPMGLTHSPATLEFVEDIETESLKTTKKP
jgi:hypothetical protein